MYCSFFIQKLSPKKIQNEVFLVTFVQIFFKHKPKKVIKPCLSQKVVYNVEISGFFKF